uniref:CCHC-type domain-containing protein n=1 Tax=Strongyloides venezuelensis TaxID=75913 RepID=A0A0K0F4S9_STRVS
MKSPEDIIKMCWSSKGITECLKELLLREFGGFQNPLVKFIELMNGDLDSDDPEDALTKLQTKDISDKKIYFKLHEINKDKADKIAKVAKLEFQNRNESFNKVRKVDYRKNQTYFRRNVTRNSEIICYKCNGRNHISTSCNSKFGLNITCEECGGKCQYTNNCPNVKKTVQKLHSKRSDDSCDVVIDNEN